MGIDTYMKRLCRMTAVYWASPTPDGYGGFTYSDPVEIACFWMEEIEMLKDDDGREMISKAKLFVLDDLDEQAKVCKCTLADLTEAQKADPSIVDDAYTIKRFVKTPSLHYIEGYVRKGYL